MKVRVKINSSRPSIKNATIKKVTICKRNPSTVQSLLSWRQPYGAPSLQSTPHLVRRADSPETDLEMRRLAEEIITDQQSEDETSEDSYISSWNSRWRLKRQKNSGVLARYSRRNHPIWSG